MSVNDNAIVNKAIIIDLVGILFGIGLVVWILCKI